MKEHLSTATIYSETRAFGGLLTFGAIYEAENHTSTFQHVDMMCGVI